MPSFLDTIGEFRYSGQGAALITTTQILAWAEAHRAATGRWPTRKSGPIGRSRSHKTWKEIDTLLKRGLNGAQGVTLARLLHEHRGAKLRVTEDRMLPRAESGRSLGGADFRGAPPLSLDRILAWADAHRAETGRWPTMSSGAIAGVRGDNWRTVAYALRQGLRGLPGGTTLHRLLRQHRSVRVRGQAPDLTEQQILRWADAHHQTRGRWPGERSGKVFGVPDETWSGLDKRLRHGGRGLPGGSSLARLLAGRRRGSPAPLPDLSVAAILTWVDAHRTATGRRPTCRSGKVRAAPGEAWGSIDQSLRSGWRGLRGGTTLARLLDKHRPLQPRALTLELILEWAHAHRAANGCWPTVTSGPVAGAPGETWGQIDVAIRCGFRGLSPGLGLSRLLRRRRARPLARLTLDQVRAWAEAHRAATGQWPTRLSGPIPGAPGENWENINSALRAGFRGLPGGVSLATLVAGWDGPPLGGQPDEKRRGPA